jgi:hypothetical protein
VKKFLTWTAVILLLAYAGQNPESASGAISGAVGAITSGFEALFGSDSDPAAMAS